MTIAPDQIAKAWHSVTDDWIVRRNKMRDARQWEVVHDWGGDVISEETQKVVGRFHSEDAAVQRALALENVARGRAVLDFIGEPQHWKQRA